MTTIKVELAEGLVVGPDDRLIIQFPGDFPMDDDNVENLHQTLNEMGIGDRTLIMFGDRIELTKIESD